MLLLIDLHVLPRYTRDSRSKNLLISNKQSNGSESNGSESNGNEANDSETIVDILSKKDAINFMIRARHKIHHNFS